MKNQSLLDELGRKTKQERLKVIIQNSDYIFSDEFIDFLQGLMEFAETTAKDSRYFERIYMGENSSFIEQMKSEFEKQAELVQDVWNSILEFNRQYNAKVLIKSGDGKDFTNTDCKTIENVIPCGKCDELISSHGLCNGCLSGRFPSKIAERLQTNLESADSHLVSYEEIISNRYFNR